MGRQYKHRYGKLQAWILTVAGRSCFWNWTWAVPGAEGYLGSWRLSKLAGDAGFPGEATLDESLRMGRSEPETQMKCEFTT